MAHQSGIPKEPMARIAVIGVGNLLLRDEGIGIHVIRALEKLHLPADIILVDGGTSPDIIAGTKASEKMVIIDAASTGGKPGTVYRLTPRDITAIREIARSAHEMGVAENLRMMELLGNRPKEIVILGIEPKEIDWGTELSAALKNKLPQIVSTVLREIGLTSAPDPKETP